MLKAVLFHLKISQAKKVKAEWLPKERAAMPREISGKAGKVSPSVKIKPKNHFYFGEITGPGSIQHIWMTPTGNWRYSILGFIGTMRRSLP
jgi:hypothetical protein